MTTSPFVPSALAVLSAVALSLTALSVSSCKPKGAEVPVTGITVSQPALSITEGETATISYTVEPSDASVKGVAFSSSDPGVATVDENGVVTAVSPGTATITVTTRDGGFKASVTVTVKAKGSSGPGTDTSVKVTGITLDKSELSIGVGTYSVLVATVEPSNAADKTVEWKSSKPAVAVVDDEGKVSGIIPGSATITATTKDGGFKATCEVQVMTATEAAYNQWLGGWDVPRGSDVDLWTIEANVQGKSFKVSGIGGILADDYADGAFVAIVPYDAETGEMVFKVYENGGVSWIDKEHGAMNALLSGQYTNVEGLIYYNSGVGNTICLAKMSGDGLSASLTPSYVLSAGAPAYFFNIRWYGRYTTSIGSRAGISWNGYLTSLPATMTKHQ